MKWKRAWIAQWYSAGLRAGWLVVRAPAVAGNFSLHHRVQNVSGAHRASYPMGTRDSFPGGKAAGTWSWPFTSVQCRGQEYIFIAWCLVKHREKFTFTFTFIWLKWSLTNVSGYSLHRLGLIYNISMNTARSAFYQCVNLKVKLPSFVSFCI
jgi:hypothetical protein